MSRLDEVKKILDEYALGYPVVQREQTFGYTNHIHPRDVKYMMQQICRLLPKTEDNLDGYEPKAECIKEKQQAYKQGRTDQYIDCAKRDEAECRKRVERIWKVLEKGYPAITTWGFYNDLKKQEGVK